MLKTILLGVVLISTVWSDKCTKHCSHHGPSVCGTDGHTYNNQCQLDIAICQARRHGFTLTLAHNGTCNSLDKVDFHCDALCDEEGQTSVCASNGKTYESECDLKNADCVAARHGHHLTVLHKGPCLTLNGTCAKYNSTCPRTHDYKCGTTGYTYMNECYLKRAQCQQLAAGVTNPVTLLHDGKCDYNSTLKSRSVDCSQYADLSLAGVAIEGLSVKINACPSTHNQQVCATNGITFSSECNLCYRAARANKISKSQKSVMVKPLDEYSKFFPRPP